MFELVGFEVKGQFFAEFAYGTGQIGRVAGFAMPAEQRYFSRVKYMLEKIAALQKQHSVDIKNDGYADFSMTHDRSPVSF